MTNEPKSAFTLRNCYSRRPVEAVDREMVAVNPKLSPKQNSSQPYLSALELDVSELSSKKKHSAPNLSQ